MQRLIPISISVLALAACAEPDRGEPFAEVRDTALDTTPAETVDDVTPDGETVEDTREPLTFAAVHEVLLDNCTDAGCHSSGAGGFTLSGDADSDYQAVLAEVVPGDALASKLLKKATNTSSHSGGPILQAGTADYQLIADWIDDGANP